MGAPRGAGSASRSPKGRGERLLSVAHCCFVVMNDSGTGRDKTERDGKAPSPPTPLSACLTTSFDPPRPDTGTGGCWTKTLGTEARRDDRGGRIRRTWHCRGMGSRWQGKNAPPSLPYMPEKRYRGRKSTALGISFRAKLLAMESCQPGEPSEAASATSGHLRCAPPAMRGQVHAMRTCRYEVSPGTPCGFERRQRCLAENPRGGTSS